MSSTAADALVRRILDVVPARTHAIAALLQLFRVETTTAVPTASVSCERRPVLRVNPRFVAERCRTDAHLFMFVMHELHHVLLGHTRLFPRSTPAHNLAFDAVINALLVLQHPQRAYTSFFLDIYGGETGALRLLAPPGDPSIRDESLAALHRLLYDGSGKTTSEEIFRVIAAAAGEQAENVPDGDLAGQLLGSHDATGEAGDEGDARATAGPVDRDVVQAIREIVERWPKPEGTRRGRSLADVLESDSVAQAPVGRQVLAALRRALLGASVRSRSIRRRGPGLVPGQVVLPDLRDRRGAVLRASGNAPLLYDSRISSPRARDEGQARVYMDVSGSMDAYLPYLYAALSQLRQLVQPQVGLFSTKVVTVPLADFLRGRADTTGGTDVACVLKDLLITRPRRALVITDGYVGRVSTADKELVDRAGVDVRAVLTPGGLRTDLEPLASRFDVLPELDATE
jgi:hypothetical protein